MFSRLGSPRASRRGPATRVLRDLSLPRSLEWVKLPATTRESGMSARAFGRYFGGGRQTNERHDNHAWEART